MGAKAKGNIASSLSTQEEEDERRGVFTESSIGNFFGALLSTCLENCFAVAQCFSQSFGEFLRDPWTSSAFFEVPQSSLEVLRVL